ncbi:MAG: hypothetical protein JSS51_09815 [Planctomycetes bacterium]|nr:hypothetical protein [Planctomycetota bacterium]
MHLAQSEKRLDQRQRRSGSITWRFMGSGGTQAGWLLESSLGGAAFAWRGERPPPPGTLIQMVDFDDVEVGRGVVRRAVQCHEDLSVIALEWIVGGPFPAPLTHAPSSSPTWAIGSAAEPKPIRHAARGPVESEPLAELAG